MANPDIPVAASFPIPPPVFFNFPWTSMVNGQAMLTPMAMQFLQILWASIQGGGGVLDLLLAAFPNAGETAAQTLGLIDADPRLAAVLGALRGEIARLDAGLDAANILALQLRPPPVQAAPVALTYSLVASEALAANTLVNVWSDAGAFHVRQADTTDTIANAHEAQGFVRQAYAMGDAVTLVFTGILTGLTALTPGAAYLGAAGAVTSTPNVTAGQISQQVGIAVAADTLVFQPQPAFGT